MTTPHTASPSGEVRDAESLLERLAESALDDDYYAVRESPSSPAIQIVSAILVAIFGLLVTIVAVQTRVDRPASERERSALIDNISTRQELLVARRTSVENLQAEIDGLSTRSTVGLPGLRIAEMNASAVPVTGDGVEVVLKSSDEAVDFGFVTDTDVQLAVNGLWLAGAETIDVNGHRLTATSAIRSAGEGITVNYRSLPEPIKIRAIGSQQNLGERMTSGPSGRYLDERAKVSQISWNIQTANDISMTAAPGARLKVNHAKAIRRGD